MSNVGMLQTGMLASLAVHDETEPPTPDFDALFKEPPPKRHKWTDPKFKGSFVCHSRISTCTKCGLERHRQFDYGQHRTIFRDPKADKWFTNDNPSWGAKTPSCSR